MVATVYMRMGVDLECLGARIVALAARQPRAMTNDSFPVSLHSVIIENTQARWVQRLSTRKSARGKTLEPSKRQ